MVVRTSQSTLENTNCTSFTHSNRLMLFSELNSYLLWESRLTRNTYEANTPCDQNVEIFKVKMEWYERDSLPLGINGLSESGKVCIWTCAVYVPSSN